MMRALKKMRGKPCDLYVGAKRNLKKGANTPSRRALAVQELHRPDVGDVDCSITLPLDVHVLCD